MEVNHKDFDDCYFKIGTTLYALMKKEVWVNMIGGTNQINLSLLIAGSFFAVPSRYYYIFQSKIDLLHPEVDRPSLKYPIEFLNYLDRWHEIPIFHLEIGSIIKKLDEKLSEREYIHLRELKELLQEKGFPKQYIAKLRGRLLLIDDGRVAKGPLLDVIVGMIRRIEEQEVSSVSKWIEWGRKNRILWRCNLDGKLVRV